MLRDFKKDLEAAKPAEELVLRVLEAKTPVCLFHNVSDLKQYRYKGDIQIFVPTGTYYYVEVKNDSRIAETHNILCEEEVYYKNDDYYGQGNMCGDSDYYAVVSQAERKIYLLDFKRLQSIYRKGEYKEIKHYDQITYCYLLNLSIANKYGALIEIINY